MEILTFSVYVASPARPPITETLVSHPVVSSGPRAFLCGVCMCSPCLCATAPGSPVPSNNAGEKWLFLPVNIYNIITHWKLPRRSLRWSGPLIMCRQPGGTSCNQGHMVAVLRSCMWRMRFSSHYSHHSGDFKK